MINLEFKKDKRLKRNSRQILPNLLYNYLG